MRKHAQVKEYSPVTTKIRLACIAAALVPLTLLAAACSSGSNSNSNSQNSAPMTGPSLPTKPNTSPASLTETGSTLMFPLMGSWATAYQKQFVNSGGDPVVTITTGGTGSGTGITDAATGTVNIGASDAYLSSANLQQYPGLMNIALAISAQQVNFNVPGVKKLNLNGSVLAQIYTGKVTNWNDPAIAKLNPGVSLPNLKIIPLHRAESSGDTFLFTSYMNAQDPSAWSSSNVNTTVNWPSVQGALAETGNSGMIDGCAANKGCIAYIGISYLSKAQDAGLGTASLANKAGKFLQPTPAAIKAAAAAFTAKTPANESISMINGPAPDGYPIIKKSQSDAVKAEDIKTFLHWTIHTGQDQATYLDPVFFQKLPPSVVKL